MKNRLGVALLLVFVLLAGCSQAASKETVSNMNGSIESDAVAAVTTVPSLPLPSSEGLSLIDERIGVQPVMLEIPVLNVNASIEEVGRLENGQMGVPQNPDNVGWFAPGIRPGSPGNAVMAGHVDSLTGPAVFFELDKLEKGDEIIVHDKDNGTLRFIVIKIASYPRENAPVDEIFGFTYGSSLNLITCTGEFNRKAKTHEERLVIYTELSNP